MDCTATYSKMYNKFLDQEGKMTMKERLKCQKELMDKMATSFPEAWVYIMKGRIKEE